VRVFERSVDLTKFNMPLRGDKSGGYNGQNIGKNTITTENKINVSGIPTFK
jgi:hypothetical protein